MKGNSKGFSLIELLVVVVIVGILAAVALPSFIQWRRGLDYKEAARDIASILRDARARAIASNREYRVEFNIGGRQYRLLEGTSASNTPAAYWATICPTNYPNCSTLIKDWVALPQGVNMVSGQNCGNADVTIEFNPNGRSDTTVSAATDQYICIRDTNNTNQYQVGVVSNITGRVRIFRWSGAAWF